MDDKKLWIGILLVAFALYAAADGLITTQTGDLTLQSQSKKVVLDGFLSSNYGRGSELYSLAFGRSGISGSLQYPDIYGKHTGGVLAISGDVYGGGSVAFSGNVGVGTSTPSAKLDVAGKINARKSGSYADIGVGEHLIRDYASTLWLIGGTYRGVYIAPSYSWVRGTSLESVPSTGYFEVYWYPNTYLNKGMRVQGDLTVTGNLKVYGTKDGFVTDFVESVDGKFEVGDVVCIAGESDAKLTTPVFEDDIKEKCREEKVKVPCTGECVEESTKITCRKVKGAKATCTNLQTVKKCAHGKDKECWNETLDVDCDIEGAVDNCVWEEKIIECVDGDCTENIVYVPCTEEGRPPECFEKKAESSCKEKKKNGECYIEKTVEICEETMVREESGEEDTDIPVAKVAKCDKNEDTSVFGVISHLPEEDGGYYRAVTLGAFDTIKVDARKNPVKAGDLLVSSNNAGYAVAAEEPKPYSVVGKALEDLDSGKGTIAVKVISG